MPKWNEQQRRAVEIRERNILALSVGRQRQDDRAGRPADGSGAQEASASIRSRHDLYGSGGQRDEEAAVRRFAGCGPRKRG